MLKGAYVHVRSTWVPRCYPRFFWAKVNLVETVTEVTPYNISLSVSESPKIGLAVAENSRNQQTLQFFIYLYRLTSKLKITISWVIISNKVRHIWIVQLRNSVVTRLIKFLRTYILYIYICDVQGYVWAGRKFAYNICFNLGQYFYLKLFLINSPLFCFISFLIDVHLFSYLWNLCTKMYNGDWLIAVT